MLEKIYRYDYISGQFKGQIRDYSSVTNYKYKKMRALLNVNNNKLDNVIKKTSFTVATNTISNQE